MHHRTNAAGRGDLVIGNLRAHLDTLGCQTLAGPGSIPLELEQDYARPRLAAVVRARSTHHGGLPMSDAFDPGSDHATVIRPEALARAADAVRIDARFVRHRLAPFAETPAKKARSMTTSRRRRANPRSVAP